MNQILQVQANKKNSKPVDTKKVVLFFAVSIIIFGLIILGQGAYNVYLAKNIMSLASDLMLIILSHTCWKKENMFPWHPTSH